MKAKLHINDRVLYLGEVWRIVTTTTDGSKADLQRLQSSNPVIARVMAKHVQVVWRFGSPNSCF